MVSNLANNHPNLFEYGSIIVQCRGMLSLSTNFQICFARKQRNTIAHELGNIRLGLIGWKRMKGERRNHEFKFPQLTFLTK